MRQTLAPALDSQPLARRRHEAAGEPARSTLRSPRRTRLAARTGLRPYPCQVHALPRPAAVQPSPPVQPARAALGAQSATRASEAVARRVLLAIRGAIGVLFVACGVRNMLDLAPAGAMHVQPGVMAFGGALLLAGSLLPLLKGTELLVEFVLDLQRTLVGEPRR